MKSEESATARTIFTFLPLKGLDFPFSPSVRRRRNGRRALLVESLSLLLASCISGTAFHSYKPLPLEGWERCDTVCFELPKAVEDINGTLTIGLRTMEHVGMQDIVLAVEQCDESAGVCRCDTVRYPLTDAEGDALTPGVNYHQYETQHLPISMKKGQGGSVRIHHLMTPETMHGITELGIKISF